MGPINCAPNPGAPRRIYTAVILTDTTVIKPGSHVIKAEVGNLSKNK